MGSETKIQWADHTFNPWRGCTKIAPGCANCYADQQSKRNPGVLGVWGPNGTRVVASEAMWREPLRWNKVQQCYPQVPAPRVFCASLADVFEDWPGVCVDSRGRELFTGDGRRVWWDHHADDVPPCDLELVRARLFRTIDATPNLIWLVLTKRPENIRRMWPGVTVERDESFDPPKDRAFARRRDNVWLGVSIACQEDADRLIPELSKCRDLCAKTFLSIEPMIGPVDISQWIGYNPLHENNSQRRSGVRGCQNGTLASAGRRVRVETEIPSQESLGRTDHDNEREDTDANRRGVRTGVSPSQSNDGRASGDMLGPSVGVAALQWSDPERHADKSQGRRQNQQSSGQSGSVFAVGQHNACSQNWADVPEGHAQQPQQSVANGCGGDSSSVRGWKGNASDDRGQVRSFASSSIEDRSRTADDNRAGTNSGLYASEASRNEPRRERQISFVIVGGESGPNARPCNVEWVRSIVRQCKAAGVPCFVKQLGANAHDGLRPFPNPDDEPEWIVLRDTKGGDPAEWPEDLRVREVPS